MNDKAVVIYSGGLDSTVLLTKCVQQYDKVVALNFNYGSKHNYKERVSAREVCHKFGVELVEVNLPFIEELFKSDLLKSGGDIPEGNYDEESMKSTVVPFRNGIMLSIAAGFAESRGFNLVAIANHAGDHTIYRDCRGEFIEAIHQAIVLGTENVGMYAPFTEITKTDIVRLGDRINAPMQLSWSCYKGGEKHCGKCGTCRERIEAFKENSLIDQVEYSIEIDW